MATRSTKPDWSVSAVDYGRSLKGFGANLLVRDVEASKNFAEQVLNAGVVYWNEDFAVLHAGEAQWMLHADHTYDDNPSWASSKALKAGARASSCTSTSAIPTRPRRPRARGAISYWRAASTSPTACANATSSIPTAIAGSQAVRWRSSAKSDEMGSLGFRKPATVGRRLCGESLRGD